MNVTFTNNPQMPNNLNSASPQQMILLIAQSLRRCNDDGITSVSTKRVKVLHVTNSNAVVLRITDNLVLDFLPALHGAFHENLGGEGKGGGSKLAEFVVIVGETGTETAEGKSGTDDDGVADLVGGGDGIVDGFDGGGAGNWDVDVCVKEGFRESSVQ